MLLLYKFGGFYLDLDVVSLNELTHYQDIVVLAKPGLITNSHLAFRIRSSQIPKNKAKGPTIKCE